jgi:hypothetical protein
MSRDRQIAVLASIVGLAGLIVGIVAISQVSGAEDDWVRNRALPGAASSEGAVLQTQVAVQEVADLAERVAELEKTPVPEGPEEVTPTVEIPTEEVDYAENVDSLAPIGEQPELDDDDQAGTWTSQDEAVPDGALRLPDDPSAVQSGTLQSFSTNGVPAFIEHIELAVTIPEMKYQLESRIGILALCNYLPKTCMTIGEEPYGTSWVDTFNSVYTYDIATFETNVVSDEYLTYELRCPNVAKLLDADSDNFPSIAIRQNNKYSSYAYKKTSAYTPWPGFPLQESIALIPWENDGIEFSLATRPWITSSQRDLSLMYEYIYDAAEGDAGYGYSLTVDGVEYPWYGWFNAAEYVIPNLDWIMTASEFYVSALNEFENKPNYKVNNANIKHEFWADATKASLAFGVEQWPPPYDSFWAKMRDLIEYVPTTVRSRSLVRIYDSTSGEYHWSLITADLAYYASEQEGDTEGKPWLAQNVGHCNAAISITRSYE